MEYPKGTKFGLYFLALERSEDKETFVIRRNVTLPDGSQPQPRYPRKLYRHLKSKEEISQMVDRLNYRQMAKMKRAIEVRTAFIPSSLMEEFRAQLKLEIPNEKDFHYQYNTVLQRYFLNFFVSSLGLLDPNQWHQNQSKWGAALLGESDIPEHNVFSKKMSFKTIKRSIQIANRFMAFLHVKDPSEYKKYEFEPISRAALNLHRAETRQKSRDNGGIGKFIPPEDWEIIKANAPRMLSPFINLMYHYGLRRAESLGFESTDNVKKGYLDIKRQLKKMTPKPKFGPLKNRLERQTKHWFAKPVEAFRWIELGLEHRMHPDTLSEHLEKFMKQLFESKDPRKKISAVYESHDFRRTFITRALRLHTPREIQLAVGHASISTTMGYAMDDRDLDHEIFDPDAA